MKFFAALRLGVKAEAGEKTSATVIQKIFANCPCRENECGIKNEECRRVKEKLE